LIVYCKGNPNGPNVFLLWPKYELINSTTSDVQRAFFKLDVGLPQVDYNLKVDECAFWYYTVPAVGNFTVYSFD
jgi:hypothetical protein